MGLGIDMRIGIVARAVLNEDGKASGQGSPRVTWSRIKGKRRGAVQLQGARVAAQLDRWDRRGSVPAAEPWRPLCAVGLQRREGLGGRGTAGAVVAACPPHRGAHEAAVPESRGSQPPGTHRRPGR